MKINTTKRDDIEHNLYFLGFLVMENKLKAVTSETIKTLNNCKVRTIMATGDNTLTAISVARQCKILDKDQDVYFGDIVNQKLVWKSQVGGDDSIRESII